jgi:hypothetical protein
MNLASINLQGDTSGSISISAPSVAGSNTLTLPKTTSTLATENALGVRNLIINGDMRIAQRGTSATGLGNGDGGYHTVDRWQFFEGGAFTGEFTMSQDTDVPSGQGFSHSLKFDCTTADTALASGDSIRIYHKLEGQMLQHLKYGTSSAETLTLSFWVKSNKTGSYTAFMYQFDNAYQQCHTFTVDTADTWEKKTITINPDTVNSIDNDNGAGLLVSFIIGAGTDFTSGTQRTDWTAILNADSFVGQTVNLADSTSNYINITGVQLEVGTATPFEHRPYDMELARCQRYFHKTNPLDDKCASFLFGTMFGSATGALSGTFPTVMRAAPTVTRGGTHDNFWVAGASSGATGTFAASTILEPDGVYIETTSMSHGALGYPIGYNGQLSFSAEL